MPVLSLRSSRSQRRARYAIGIATVAGILAIAASQPAIGLGLLMLALMGVVLLELSDLRRLVVQNEREMFALTQIRPLLGELPLELGRWAADPILLYNVIRLILEIRPRLIVECGSGNSTVVMARCLRALGSGRILSIDHEPAYANRTGELLRLYQVADLVDVVAAPLTPRELNGRVVSWYGKNYESFLGSPIDLLLVDGPPGSSSPRARYPAVPLLRTHLAARYCVVLDDGDRPDERAAAQAWSRELGVKAAYLEGGRGGWLLRGSAADPVVRPLSLRDAH